MVAEGAWANVLTMWRLVVTIVFAACTATSTPSPPAVASSAASPSASSTIDRPPWPAVVTPALMGGPGCRPPSELVTLLAGGGLRPLLGTPGAGTDTRAVLAFFLVPTARVEQKMILRINGTGGLVIHAQHDDGTRIQANGVDAGHGSSSYDPFFPGTNEYGILMTFPKGGCWQVHVQRTDAAADFYVIVG